MERPIHETDHGHAATSSTSRRVQVWSARDTHVCLVYKVWEFNQLRINLERGFVVSVAHIHLDTGPVPTVKQNYDIRDPWRDG